MIKFVNTAITFLEVPNEVTLCINISNCKIHCPKCHSKYLWKDIGEELTIDSIKELIKLNEGISCICFMGGSYKELLSIICYIHANIHIKVAWYTGLDIFNAFKEIPEFIYPDYLKVGAYCSELGGLSSDKTNQRLYEIDLIATVNDRKEMVLNDITWKLKM